MLLHDQQVRLTRREREILRRLTGGDPCNITTREELREWAECYLKPLPGDGSEISAIKDLLRHHLPVWPVSIVVPRPPET